MTRVGVAGIAKKILKAPPVDSKLSNKVAAPFSSEVGRRQLGKSNSAPSDPSASSVQGFRNPSGGIAPQ